MGLRQSGHHRPVEFASDWMGGGHSGRDVLRQLTYERGTTRDVDEILLERADYQIRLADSPGHRCRVSMLIDRMYSWRGYKWDQTEIPHDPNQITLQAGSGEEVFGTLTLGLDSESGLLADHLYRCEIDQFRNRGRKVCELARLAVDQENGSKDVLASLFHLAYIYGRLLHRVTDVFIEVNPRHVRFYERMLGFVQVGAQKQCERVGAPAVLMHLELDYVDRQIERYAGHHGRGKRSLYPYFFSNFEQEGLARRILGSSVPEHRT